MCEEKGVAMPEATQFTIGVDATCTDGVCGKVSRVVVDPVAGVVTHLVVEPKHRQGEGRLVPLDLVDARPDQVQLRSTTAEFEQLEAAEETQFLPGSSGYGGYGPGQTFSWPYYGMGMAGVPQAVTHETFPLSQVAVRRGEQVHATDGVIGRVKGLVINRDDHHVTHVLLQAGHLWGRKEVAIPIASVTGVEDGIQLSIAKREVQNLPPVEVDHPSE
jgi:sporulation protein YlmC with PRC-barrel domain